MAHPCVVPPPRVSPYAGSSYPEYLELSRGPPIVGSISVCQEQLSGVPRLVEGTSDSRKYLRLPGAVLWRGPPIVGLAENSYPEYLELSRGPPSVRSISVTQKREQLSKGPPVVESTYSCPKYLQLSRVTFVRQGAS